ncbi:MAG: hypothetical protein WCG28_00245 [bacterium]
MDKNKKIVFGIVSIIVLVGAFYGGMTYGGNNVRASINSRGQNFAQNQGGAGGMRGTRAGGGFIAGKIISKDATSITVQLTTGGNETTSPTQGGSKIIFLSASTNVSKIATGSTSDLIIGTSVSITGTPNTDGSISAQSVQIRPNTPPVLK